MALSRAAIQGMRGALTVLAAVAWVACGASQQQQQAQDADGQREQSAAAEESVPDQSIGASPSCVGENDQPVACLSDSDCCAGFVCGKDPELSHRTSFCIYGG
jgi:hypothetical protein